MRIIIIVSKTQHSLRSWMACISFAKPYKQYPGEAARSFDPHFLVPTTGGRICKLPVIVPFYGDSSASSVMNVFLLASLKLKQNDPSESCSCCMSIVQTVYLETDSCSDFIQDDFPYVVSKTETDTEPNYATLVFQN